MRVLGGVSVSQSFQVNSGGSLTVMGWDTVCWGDGKLPGSIRQGCTHLCWGVSVCGCSLQWGRDLISAEAVQHCCSCSDLEHRNLLTIPLHKERPTSVQARWSFIPVQWINRRGYMDKAWRRAVNITLWSQEEGSLKLRTWDRKIEAELPHCFYEFWDRVCKQDLRYINLPEIMHFTTYEWKEHCTVWNISGLLFYIPWELYR